MNVRRDLAWFGKSWTALLWVVLGCFWLLWTKAALDHMLPRLAYLFGTSIHIDPPCQTPECDFTAFWPAGLLARHGAFTQIYDPARFHAFQQHLFNLQLGVEAFFYPPPMLLPSALAAYLPFEPSFFAWSAALLLSAILLLRWAGLSWLVILAGCLSPAAVWCLELGQIGIVGGAIFVAGLMRALDQPGKAGALLGFLALKPQLGLLAPAVAFARQNLRSALGFIVCVIALVGLTTLLFGKSVWGAYFTYGVQETRAVINQPFNPHIYMGDGISVFWMLRSFHVGLALANLVQACVTGFAVLTAIWIWRWSDAPTLDRAAATVLLTLLATPYGYISDMVGGAWILAALAERRGGRIFITDLLFWLWPPFCPLIAIQTGHLFSPLIIMASLLRLMFESAQRKRPYP